MSSPIMYLFLLLVALAATRGVFSKPASDVEKYCGFLDCKTISTKKDETFQAKGTTFGYCKCIEKTTKYYGCNFGTEYNLEKQDCVKPKKN
uniref:Putative 7.8-9.7 kDa secreted peptide n=1 Tax=Psorophora albipes TaxID=869069 RepID=T1D5N0_9DIPT